MITIKKIGASWCGPCKSLSATLEQVLPKYPNVTLEDFDIDQNQDMAKEYGIRSVPTMIKFKDGVEIGRLTGVQTVEKLSTWLTD